MGTLARVVWHLSVLSGERMTDTYVADGGAGASLVASDTATVIKCRRCDLAAAVAWPNDPLVNVQTPGGAVTSAAWGKGN
jgi:hypothetical protein